MNIRLSHIVVLTACSLMSCSASRRVSEAELRSDPDIELVSVRQKDNTLLDFSKDPLGYAILRDSVIYRRQHASPSEFIPIDKVEMSTARRRRTTGEEILDIALMSVAGVAVVFFLLGGLQFPGW